MKKKIFSIILALALISIPFVFSGCESNMSASQISNEYTNIQSEHSTLFSNRVFKVTFTGSQINANMNYSSSTIYSLGKVYLPLVNASMAFVNSRATSFKSDLEKFSQDELNMINAKMTEFKTALAEFDTQKSSFDKQNKVDGTGYAQLTLTLNNLIDTALDFNLAYYNAYYTNIYAKERDYNVANFKFKADDVKVEVLGNKLYLAKVLYCRYVKFYTWTKGSDGSIVTFLNKPGNEYLKNTIDIVGSTSSYSYEESYKNTMIALRENHNTFVTDLNKALASIEAYDYKGYYKAGGSASFEESQSQSSKDHKKAFDAFMSTRYMAIYNAICLLI